MILLENLILALLDGLYVIVIVTSDACQYVMAKACNAVRSKPRPEPCCHTKCEMNQVEYKLWIKTCRECGDGWEIRS